jgi:hypothetical protein
VTDRELLEELQYVLIEPPTGGDSWPSLIWTRPEVLDAVNSAIRALIHDTHMYVERREIAVLAKATRIALPTNWVATASLVWRAADGTRTPLGPADGFESDLAAPGWEAASGLPLGYADLDNEMRTLRLVPTPTANGTIELLYVALPSDIGLLIPAEVTRLGIMRLGVNRLGYVAGPKVLPVAEAFTSAIKYAALGTLLRKVGRLLDDERAQYCERRYQLSAVAADILLAGWG